MSNLNTKVSLKYKDGDYISSYTNIDEMRWRNLRLAAANEVKFTYFRVGQGRAVVAGVRINNYSEEKSPPLFFYGISFCSPKDRFERNKGRNLALRRLFAVIQSAQVGYITDDPQGGYFFVEEEYLSATELATLALVETVEDYGEGFCSWWGPKKLGNILDAIVVLTRKKHKKNKLEQFIQPPIDIKQSLEGVTLNG